MNCNDIARVSSLYLSGELDAPSTLEFNKHLQACQLCAGELKQQSLLDAALRSSVLSDEIDSTSVEQRIRRHIASPPSVLSWRWLTIAASLVAMILAVALGYRAISATGSNRLCVDAAQDHRNEVTLGQRRAWLSDAKAIADLAQRNGIHGLVIATLAPAGYHLEHGKLCRLGGHVFLHLVYARGADEYSIYLRPLDGRSFSGPMRETVAGKLLHEVDSGNEHVAYFQTSRLTAMFVTDQSREEALSFARSAAHVL